ncbi:MAG: DUF4189 domain-containing protein [Pseudomonadota bacterium]
MGRRSRRGFPRSWRPLSVAIGLSLAAASSPAQADFGAIATAEGALVSWGGAVAASPDEARAAARAACEDRFEGAVCERVRDVPPDRCFAIAVDQPMRRSVGYADDVNLRIAKIEATHACRRAGGMACILSHTECVPPDGG